MDTFLLSNGDCVGADECPIGTEPNTEQTECVLAVDTFLLRLWEEPKENDEKTMLFDMKIDELDVEIDSYIEFMFPPNTQYVDGTSTCAEREEGGTLTFVQLTSDGALYQIGVALTVGDIYKMECTRLTHVFLN